MANAALIIVLHRLRVLLELIVLRSAVASINPNRETNRAAPSAERRLSADLNEILFQSIRHVWSSGRVNGTGKIRWAEILCSIHSVQTTSGPYVRSMRRHLRCRSWSAQRTNQNHKSLRIHRCRARSISYPQAQHHSLQDAHPALPANRSARRLMLGLTNHGHCDLDQILLDELHKRLDRPHRSETTWAIRNSSAACRARSACSR